MDAKKIVEHLNAAGAEMRDLETRIQSREIIYARMVEAGYVRRPDGVWMMPARVGLGPAESVYADHDKGYTLD